jgi:membrane protease subunit HflK
MYENNQPGGNTPNYRDVRGKAARGVRRFGLLAVILIALAVAAFGSAYTVKTGEEAVITRWGRYVETVTEPGLQFKLPFIDKKHIVNVEGVRRLEFGSRTDQSGNYVDVMDEALMLTQEENLVLADWVVQYRISNSYDFLFNVQNPEEVLRIISESAYRRVTAAHPLDDILTDQKERDRKSVV